MSGSAIRAEMLGKKYRIGRSEEKYKTLRDVVVNAVSSPFRKAGRILRGDSYGASDLSETIWALKEVSFEIRQGDLVGIVGKNGSGKSTLLKILSRITEPTTGSATVRGRVGSLLEVGTGFHQELTGRENIYLSGAILGMRKHEILRKFEEIVSFAEIEKFIDTPVKHYSSGMYLRLAFAVAAHLEPEILLVDEVLAVGDARFQKKCLNKMQDVGSEGRTVLFVSHNMPAVTRLCRRAILLDEGRLVQDDASYKVVSAYLTRGTGTSALREWPDETKAPGREITKLRAVRVCGADGGIADRIDVSEQVTLEMAFEVYIPGHILLPHFLLTNEDGIELFTTIDQDPSWRKVPRPAGRYTSSVTISGHLLAEGTVFVEANLITLEPLATQFSVKDAVVFQVVDSLESDSARGDWLGHMIGVVRPLLNWSTRYNPASGPAPK